MQIPGCNAAIIANANRHEFSSSTEQQQPPSCFSRKCINIMGGVLSMAAGCITGVVSSKHLNSEASFGVGIATMSTVAILFTVTNYLTNKLCKNSEEEPYSNLNNSNDTLKTSITSSTELPDNHGISKY